MVRSLALLSGIVLAIGLGRRRLGRAEDDCRVPVRTSACLMPAISAISTTTWRQWPGEPHPEQDQSRADRRRGPSHAGRPGATAAAGGARAGATAGHAPQPPTPAPKPKRRRRGRDDPAAAAVVETGVRRHRRRERSTSRRACRRNVARHRSRILPKTSNRRTPPSRKPSRRTRRV